MLIGHMAYAICMFGGSSGGDDQLVLLAPKWTKEPARKPLLMAFIMGLQATLWRSVIIYICIYLYIYICIYLR